MRDWDLTCIRVTRIQSSGCPVLVIYTTGHTECDLSSQILFAAANIGFTGDTDWWQCWPWSRRMKLTIWLVWLCELLGGEGSNPRKLKFPETCRYGFFLFFPEPQAWFFFLLFFPYKVENDLIFNADVSVCLARVGLVVNVLRLSISPSLFLVIYVSPSYLRIVWPCNFYL